MPTSTAIRLVRVHLCACLLLAMVRIGQTSPPDLTQLSLEELMNLEVALVSRRPEPLATTPAAAAVLTREDLLRAGIRSIPDALRLVPGVQVGRVDANKWAVTTRGFAGVFANKLLVLVDGRSVYTPLFSGVFWESQDVVAEDVERIEVIRGPGGSLWGTNSVNGIIDIVTRSAAVTHGWLAQVGGGTAERFFATLRYGGQLENGPHFRTYAKFLARDRSSAGPGRQWRDEWSLQHGGGRLDWQFSARDSLSLIANLYAGEVGQSLVLATSLEPPYSQLVHATASIRGSSLVGRWERQIDDRNQLALRVYVDRTERREDILRGTIHSADVDFQLRTQPAEQLELTWGLGYRLIWDEFTGSFTMSLEPSSYSSHLLSGFLHAGLSLLPRRLYLSLGTKLEHNSYTGPELQPGARLWWSPAPSHILWTAVSRAARIPSRSERHFRGTTRILPPDSLFPRAPVARVVLMGDPQYDSEKMRGLEAGYRTRCGDLFLDLTAFNNHYTQVRTNEPGLPFREDLPAPSHLVVPVRVANKASGSTWGWEGSVDWRRWSRWNLRAAYGYLRMHLELADDSLDSVTGTYDEEIPRHQFNLRSHLILTPHLVFAATGRFVDELPSMGVDHYLTLDLRLGWHLSDGLEFSLVGRDLLDSPHREFVSAAVPVPPVAVRASWYAALNWTP